MSKIVPDVVRDQTITTVEPNTTVTDAAKRMADRNIAAVVIVNDGKLAGIMTERDVTVRVVARGRDAATTRVADVMTADPDTLTPNQHPAEALRMMVERGYRHLPVVDGERVVGMVSVRDLYAFVQAELENDLRERDHYIFGEAYGRTT